MGSETRLNALGLSVILDLEGVAKKCAKLKRFRTEIPSTRKHCGFKSHPIYH